MNLQDIDSSLRTQTGSDISYAAQILLNGDVVAIPTETVYGLAANATNIQAVQKIYTIKNRPRHNPLIVHLGAIEQVKLYTNYIPELAKQLLEKFAPGPLTVVLPRNELIPDIVTAGLPDVAIRIPNHETTLSLLQKIGLPLAAPSANPFGYISPTNVNHVRKMLNGKIRYILEGGDCMDGIESTIVGFPNGVPTLYREGVISREEIEQIIGPVASHKSLSIKSPGMLLNHYQPKTPLIISAHPEILLKQYDLKEVGMITYNNYSELMPTSQQILLCTHNNLVSAANKLYWAMHEMDSRGYKLIIANLLPNYGIGLAINDRLYKASFKNQEEDSK